MYQPPTPVTPHASQFCATLPRCCIVGVGEHKTSCTCRICHAHVLILKDRKVRCGRCKTSGVQWRELLSEVDRDDGASVSIWILGTRTILYIAQDPKRRRTCPRPTNLCRFKVRRPLRGTWVAAHRVAMQDRAAGSKGNKCRYGR